ncbi:MAG: antitoxin family protein [Limisphaerales bacterium]
MSFISKTEGFCTQCPPPCKPDSERRRTIARGGYTETIRAVYERGVFRPLEAVELPKPAIMSARHDRPAGLALKTLVEV